jgi:hypothetical protein
VLGGAECTGFDIGGSEESCMALLRVRRLRRASARIFLVLARTPRLPEYIATKHCAYLIDRDGRVVPTRDACKP